MAIRRISARVETDITIDIDERHIAMMMTDDWQSFYYPFENETEVLEYVARCMVRFGRLDGLDGHANLPDDWAPTREVASDDSDIDVYEDKELTP